MNQILPVLMVILLACAGSSARSRGSESEWKEQSTDEQIRAALAKGKSPSQIRVCEYEEVTGSRIRQVTCRDLDQVEQDRAAARQTMMQLQQSATQKIN